MKPAIFLDRDGTIIEHVHHLRDPRDVRLIPGAANALQRLRAAGFVTVVVTNQSIVGRGSLTPDGLEEIHAVMARQLAAEGAGVDAIYHCSVVPLQSDPEVIEHPDRKPGPNMLIRAANDLGLDLGRSWMIGDSLTDVLAGRNAGCVGTMLVRTGLGSRVPQRHPAIDFVVEDLAAAADQILSEDARYARRVAGRRVAAG